MLRRFHLRSRPNKAGLPDIVTGRLPFVPSAASRPRSRSRQPDSGTMGPSVVTRGRLPVAAADAGEPIESEAWPGAEPALVSYIRSYDGLADYLLPAALVDGLAQARVDVYDGRTAPSAAYFASTSNLATRLVECAHYAERIIAEMRPPQPAERAYGELVEFSAKHAWTAEATLDAANRGYFAVLQDHLFQLTRELPLAFRPIDAKHQKLRKQAERQGYRKAASASST